MRKDTLYFFPLRPEVPTSREKLMPKDRERALPDLGMIELYREGQLVEKTLWTEIFGGTLLDSYECPDCKDSTNVPRAFTYLSLPLPDKHYVPSQMAWVQSLGY
jgi:hypothetical protein